MADKLQIYPAKKAPLTSLKHENVQCNGQLNKKGLFLSEHEVLYCNTKTRNFGLGSDSRAGERNFYRQSDSLHVVSYSRGLCDCLEKELLRVGAVRR